MGTTILEKSSKKIKSRDEKACNLTLLSKSINKKYLRTSGVELPDMSEREVVSHYTNLSKKNFPLEFPQTQS